MSITTLRGRRVILDGQIVPASIHIRDGVIAKIAPYDDVQADASVLDAGDSILMAGLVDSHVHVNDPGRAEWEGFDTATRAAAAGGETTIVDMPLNSSPVTTSSEALVAKISAMQNRCWVDVGLLGGVIPGNVGEIAKMVTHGGVVGFKCFMIYSGIEDFPAVSEDDIRGAMAVLADLKTKGFCVPLMFHAEVAGPIEQVSSTLLEADPSAYSTFLASRPKEAENNAIEIVSRLTKEYNVSSHIVHLSSADALQIIRDAHTAAAQLTAETTFHYLHLTSEIVPNGRTDFKCCPPIREQENRERLWNALADGTIGLVVSDHSPCTADLKRLQEGDFMKAWGGIASLQLGLHIIWTGARARGFSPVDIQRWVSENPARLVQIDDKKGCIKIGLDADFVIWDPDAEFIVDQSRLLIRNKLSPYNGEKLYGRVEKTILRGHIIYDNGVVCSTPLGHRIVPTTAETSAAYSVPTLPPIERLNVLPKPTFQHTINLLFETAPPLFELLYTRRPYSSYNSLIETAKRIVDDLPQEQQIDVINAHPRIGLSPATLSNMSSLSYKEQGCQGEQTNPEVTAVYEALRLLNEQYENKFGFKFVVFVAGRPKIAIIPVLQTRLQNAKQEELHQGLSEMFLIAFDRLKKLSQ
jgi:allantoinase